jgi:catechol 2,3-dioxygenase-like lactoylglutathione lyase family enzyme
MSEPVVDVAIRVQDPKAVLRFYVDALGCTPNGRMHFPKYGQRYWSVRLGSTVIKFVQHDKPLATLDRSQPAYGMSHFTIHVPDLDSVVGRCKLGGYKVQELGPIPVEAGPGRSANVWDPEGNRLELVQGYRWQPPGEDFIPN